MVVDGRVDPCLSGVFPVRGDRRGPLVLRENRHSDGYMVALIGAPAEGLTDVPE